MTKYKVVSNKAIALHGLLLLSIGVSFAQFAESPKTNEPFPANPVGMQTYINKTKPNVAIVFDNSITMNTKMKKRNMNSIDSAKLPRRVDVVKAALLNIIDDYHDTLNFSYANITDYARDLHWKIDKTAPSGYVFAPDYGSKTTKNMESYSKDTYQVLPFYVEKRKPDILQRTPGTAIDIKSSFYNNYGRKYVGYVNMREEALPDDYKDRGRGGRKLSKSIREKKVGLSLLVPHQDIYTSGYDSVNHKKALNLAVKTTGLRTSVIQYIYPNYVEYMADKIQYRCQDTFMLLITDGNTITSSDNRKAAQRYIYTGTADPKKRAQEIKKNIGLRPKSDKGSQIYQNGYKLDGDSRPYNGPDFNQQSIRSYAIGIGTNPSKFKRFEKYGNGKASTATYPEDVKEIMDEFMRDMQPSNIFSMTSPSGSFLYTSDSTSVLMANINTETKGWVGQLRFSKEFTDDNDDDDDGSDELAEYTPNYAVYIASTNKGLINLVNHGNKLKHDDLNLKSNISIDHYLKWLTVYTESEEVTQDVLDDNTGLTTRETFTVHRGDTLPIFSNFRVRSVDALSENRYLGDVLSSSLEMIGPIDKKIKAPKYLTVGSNDGMFKIYKSNPDYGKFLGMIKVPVYKPGKTDDDDEIFVHYDEEPEYDTSPYIYSFAYIPGTAKKNNGLNILQSLSLRAAPTYSFATEIPHQYNLNGETAFRTTDKGHTFLVSTLGQGAKGAFALNISGTDHDTGKPIGLDAPKNNWDKSVPLWDTSTTQFGNAASGSETLGYITGKPVIGRVALIRKNKLANLKENVKYAVVLPSGVYSEDSNAEGPTIYIYDILGVDVGIKPQTKNNQIPGTLIKKITYQLSAAQKKSFKYKNSLSEPTMIDLDNDGVMDIGYVGDMNGNLYRIDLRGKSTNQWKLELIFEGNPNRPILNAPSISRFFKRPTVIFGTGSLARDPKLADEDRYQQVLYGIVENRSYTQHANKPIRYNDPRFITQKIIRKGDKATISDNRPSSSDLVGWILPFGTGSDRGESIAQKPIIVNGTIFLQTYIYRENQEQPHKGLMCFRSLDLSDTWLYQINALTGGALNENSVYLKGLGLGGGGQKNTGLVDRPVKLIESNRSPVTSKDGEMLSGNDKDRLLDPELSKVKNFENKNEHYLNKEGDKAFLSNGMELVFPSTLPPDEEETPEPDPDPDPDEDSLQPGRISIQILF